MAIVPNSIAGITDSKRTSCKGKSNKDNKSNKDKSGKPKRPLSAYNLFFRYQREQILQTVSQPTYKPRRSHGKIGFADLARSVAEKWKSLDQITKMQFDGKAAKDKERYEQELKVWNKVRVDKMTSWYTPQPAERAMPLASNSTINYAPIPYPQKVDNTLRALKRASIISDTRSCDSDGICLLNDTSQRVIAASRLCSQKNSSVSLQDCTPLPAWSNGSFDALASSFDEECFDILSALKYFA
jgi:hypothetical protein